MRLWHLVFGIMVIASVLSICRDPAGRVALIVFVTGLGEVVFGTTSLLALFESVGSLGEAKGPVAHVEAIAVTAQVLAVATTVMSAWLFLGIWLVRVAVA
jgi:hypothetical protein